MPRFFENLQASRKPRALAEPTCGQCGYCVRGIAGLICPECGADLREVGIVPPGGRAPNPANRLAILWTIALPLPAMLITWILLMTVLPYSQTLKTNRTIFLQAPTLNSTITVLGIQRLWQPVLLRQNPAFVEHVRLFDQQHGILNLNLKTGAYNYQKSNGVQVSSSSGFSGKVLADWLITSAGITLNVVPNPGDPRIRVLCDAAVAAINEIPQGTAGKFTPLLDPSGQQMGIAHPGYNFVVHDEPHKAVIVSLCLLWIAVWLYGVRVIYHRPDAATSPTPLPA
ncbi:MAG: hypothetical protein M3O30_07725 [Planctomycetota bacterium]|nr:hypothetical protein [Planctomycetota bacterium]